MCEVGHEAVFFGGGIDGEGGAVVEEDVVAWLEADAEDGGGVEGVDALLLGGGEEDGGFSVVFLEEDSEAEFRFCFTDPSLTRSEEWFRHARR